MHECTLFVSINFISFYFATFVLIQLPTLCSKPTNDNVPHVNNILLYYENARRKKIEIQSSGKFSVEPEK